MLRENPLLLDSRRSEVDLVTVTKEGQQGQQEPRRIVKVAVRESGGSYVPSADRDASSRTGDPACAPEEGSMGQRTDE